MNTKDLIVDVSEEAIDFKEVVLNSFVKNEPTQAVGGEGYFE